MRFVTAPIAAFAILALPETHVHASGSGEASALAHRHVIDDREHEGPLDRMTTIGHGDHSKAFFLNDSFRSTSKFSQVPAFTMTTAVPDPPLHALWRMTEAGAPRAHAPPAYFISPRAPPFPPLEAP